MYLLSLLLFILKVLLEVFSNSINKEMLIEHRHQEKLTTFTSIQNAEMEFSFFPFSFPCEKVVHNSKHLKSLLMEITYVKRIQLSLK